MDNFQWTDELAKELCEYVGMRVGKDKDIHQQVELLTEDFKKSKQPLPEQPKTEWEILQFVTDYLGVKDEIFDNIGNLEFKTRHPQLYNVLSQEVLLHNKATIRIVRRLSDGEVFTVGDKVEYGSISLEKDALMKNNVTAIESFKIQDDNLFANGEGGFFIAPITHLHKHNAKEQTKEEPKHIEVLIEQTYWDNKLTKLDAKGYFREYRLKIYPDQEIPPEKYEPIKKAIERELNNNTGLPLPLVDDREVFSINDIASCYESPKDSPLYRQLMYKLYRLLEIKIHAK